MPRSVSTKLPPKKKTKNKGYRRQPAQVVATSASSSVVNRDKSRHWKFEKKVSETNRLKTKGIEVGHIFYFGDKYSKPMSCSVDSKEGKKTFVKMGSYGIGVSRLVAAIIEAKYKNEKMKWQLTVAPFHLHLFLYFYLYLYLYLHSYPTCTSV